MEEACFKTTLPLTIHSHGLELSDGISFHSHNLVIGKNGSGKTRFLKALEACYQQNQPNQAQIVTLYFPEISSFFHPEEGENQIDDGAAELGASIFEGEPINFQDFLKLAQRDNIAFLTDLFTFISIRSPAVRRRYLGDLSQLNKHLQRFLGWELCEEKINDEIMAIKSAGSENPRKLPLEDMLQEFSPGELMLFYFSLFLFYLEHVRHSKFILIIDEPEQHLHPRVLLDLIETLMSDSSIAELWVATHSLFLLPLFAFEQLVYIKHSRVLKLNRNTYQDIYDDLVGLENVDMYELLRSVENWSYYQFIVETFFLPISKDVVKQSDEQFQKLMKGLRNIQKRGPLNVLDYGVGKFRIWECLRLELPDSNMRSRLLCYEGYEPYPSSEVKCPDSVTLYTKEKDLPHGRYDVVVLMNVLHEIDPFEWEHTFQVIHNVLSDQGVLIFLEVLSLTNGEQPYGEAGYLLLQDEQVKNLFPHVQLVPLEGKEKSNCWVIPRSDLESISFTNVKDAVASLELTCESQLEQLDQKRIELAHKNDKADKKEIKLAARKYAFLSQQYINAHIALKRIHSHIIYEQIPFIKRTYMQTTTEKLAACALKPAEPTTSDI